MQEELKRYSAQVARGRQLPIEGRVGVNTGEVVVRSITTGDGQAEYTPIGHTTNLASRMQALAPTGSIAISEQTRKFVEGYFALKPLGPTQVKGVSEPVNVYEVTGLGPLRTRLQRSAGRGLTKFVGREREMEAMRHAAELAKRGTGRSSRRWRSRGWASRGCSTNSRRPRNPAGWCWKHSQSRMARLAYLPVIELLHNYFEIGPRTTHASGARKSPASSSTLDRIGGHTAVPFRCSVSSRATIRWRRWTRRSRKRRTLEAIKRILLRESLNQPLMVIFEDLHWIDDETQALLDLLADSIGNARILLLVNYRPEYSHRWGSKTYYTQLRLDPLGAKAPTRC